jgi:hypothetical protein
VDRDEFEYWYIMSQPGVARAFGRWVPHAIERFIVDRRHGNKRRTRSMRWDQSPYYYSELDRLARSTGLSRDALRASSLLGHVRDQHRQVQE